MPINRRSFITRLALAGGSALGAAAFVARTRLFDRHGAALAAVDSSAGYGPLTSRRTLNSGEALLALPEGFQYKVLGRTGSMMSDGRLTPRDHDGMAAFEVNGELRLIRNHEISKPVVVPLNPKEAYDQKGGGGTTTLLIDPETREVERSFVSLSGTATNCAGGRTPWGSWISCEETVKGRSDGFAQSHGYCFEVSARSDGLAEPVPLKAMGRFFHEAVAIDPSTGTVYLTEDRDTAGLYRFLPSVPGELRQGGRLQMLAIANQPGYDTRRGQPGEVTLPVKWVDINDPDPAGAEFDSLAVFKQGSVAGGATFARLEGIWFGDSRIYVVSTTGGDQQKGQIWEYWPRSLSSRRRPARRTEGFEGFLHLLFESPGAQVLDMPDNICGSPRGGLILCEDGSDKPMLRGLTRDGRLFDFARATAPGAESSEFAGSTFSPDGATLFVNLQRPGMTFAIWGPWSAGSL